MPKKTVRRKAVVEKKEGPREPEYMVQIMDPKMVRKDVLESLREIILFMQGYEKFRQIQTEKINLFNQLKTDTKELSSLIEGKMRKYLPKGKLRAVSAPVLREEMEEVEELEEPEEEVEVLKEAPERKEVPAHYEESAPPNELEQLESQLKDIENQLRNIQ